MLHIFGCYLGEKIAICLGSRNCNVFIYVQFVVLIVCIDKGRWISHMWVDYVTELKTGLWRAMRGPCSAYSALVWK